VQQVLVFFVIFFVGFFAGVFFDLLRAIKKVFQLGSKILFWVDILFFLLITVIVFQVLFLLHWGEIRVYVFISFFCGIIFYYLFASYWFYRVFHKFFNKCLNIIINILLIWKDLQNKSRNIINRRIIFLKSLLGKEKQHGGKDR